VRAAAGFDGPDAFGGQRIVTREKFTILFREDVIRHGGEAHAVAQFQAKLEHERCLAAADRAADADGESTPAEVAVEWEVAFVEVTGVVEALMRVTVVVMRVVRVGVHGIGQVWKSRE